MALPASVAAAVFNSALGEIRGDADGADIGEIVRKVMLKFRSDPPTPSIYYLNVVRAAQRAARAAERIGENPDIPLGDDYLPKIPESNSVGRKYEYRVVIVVTPDDGGDPFRTAVTISSDTPMSANDLHDQAIDVVNQQSFERDYRNQVDKIGSSYSIDIIIISGGRTS